ncbi:YchJ family protein [Alteromonas mediterranea]|uniref:Zinc chelation protein SecC n=1 Tax=Alteromonas mediterranea TaxID=314275 RepID=A0AAC8XKT2_9ALTE|nr:SEC-C motif domain protein [Alteromonas mediterranea DE1]AGP97865.1 SEC-C motif domain-containing protein [Alteromonas mediterranea UM7]AGQ02116.1 SEC-C motif domain-containing protein [Alteromonas mediterranea UM4b]AMJ78886.1 zinc chelation protein SecC [Alteromonas mediterranea]AMJ83034.1 zinc chelation protein SecC [Alteromonas mediterranea]|tara:strand:+ start:640 stop:1143 length:504 start_codon:yes stop_codon:yes gene_type:complete
MRCFCCSSKPFQACCEPFIKGDKTPVTAEQLMRSRFSAYATAQYAYILDTYTQEKQQGLSVDDLAQSAQGAKWFALQVHDAQSEESAEPNTSATLHSDTVEFTAFYFEDKKMYQLHETSNFRVENGAWRYHDGTLHDDCGKVKYGRNLPCVCGSSKKFKQCCANKSH